MNELHRFFSLEGQRPWTEPGNFSISDSEAKCTHLWVTLFFFFLLSVRQSFGTLGTYKWPR